jgi:hypothetical protein
MVIFVLSIESANLFVFAIGLDNVEIFIHANYVSCRIPILVKCYTVDDTQENVAIFARDSRLVVLDCHGNVRFEYPGEGGFDGTYGDGYLPVKRQAFSDVCWSCRIPILVKCYTVDDTQENVAIFARVKPPWYSIYICPSNYNYIRRCFSLDSGISYSNL